MEQTKRSTESFNLIEEPWIPVMMKGGQSEEVSIRQAFHKAKEIDRIIGDLPTQSFTLLRLLLAVLQSACTYEERKVGEELSLEQWCDIRDDWIATCDEIEAYLEEYHDYFDLFDETRPFYQVPDLHTSRNDIPGLGGIIMDVPSGAPFFTMRSGKGLKALSFAEAARWLVNTQAFDIAGIHPGAVGDPRVKGGKGYSIGTGWDGCLGGVYLEGNSLHETLCWNFVLPGEAGLSFDIELDRPVWEQRKPHEASPRTIGSEPFGQLDLFTWQSRRIRLYRENNMVTGALVAQGDPAKPQNMFRKEAFTGWRYSKPQSRKAKTDVYMPKKHQPTQQLWRSLHAMLPGEETQPHEKEPARFMYPALFHWATYLSSKDELQDEYLCRIRAVGVEYGTQESVVTEIVDDELVLPFLVLCSKDWANTALQALDSTDAGVLAVVNLASRLLEAESAAADTDAVRGETRTQAYTRLDEKYREWLAQLDTERDGEESLSDWEAQANKTLVQLSKEMMSQVSPSSIIGRETEHGVLDAARAHDWFVFALRKAFPRAYQVKESHESKGVQDG